MKAILGKKLGMSQIFTANGIVIPVTVVEAGPCFVSQKKTKAVDGYDAVQVAFEDKKASRVSKPEAGHMKKANISPKKYIKEFKLADTSLEVGAEIKCDIFAAGEFVDVTGMTKGRGFTGTVQRWNTAIGPKSHGSGYHRGVGSMGGSATPGRVFKNKKMPGQYGHEQVTIQNLEVAKVDAERNLILVKGAIPGPKGGLVTIKSAVKK